MIAFLLAPASYCAVILISRLFRLFRDTNKFLLIFIGMLINGCLLNFVEYPSDLIACGEMLSWLAICLTEFFIYLERNNMLVWEDDD